MRVPVCVWVCIIKTVQLTHTLSNSLTHSRICVRHLGASSSTWLIFDVKWMNKVWARQIVPHMYTYTHILTRTHTLTSTHSYVYNYTYVSQLAALASPQQALLMAHNDLSEITEAQRPIASPLSPYPTPSPSASYVFVFALLCGVSLLLTPPGPCCGCGRSCGSGRDRGRGNSPGCSHKQREFPRGI